MIIITLITCRQWLLDILILHDWIKLLDIRSFTKPRYDHWKEILIENWYLL